jgi:hypothetical protein
VIGEEFIADAPSPPDEVPLYTLYVTPLVGLAFQLSATEWEPVPVKPIDTGEVVALLAKLTLAPLTAPPTVGANVTVSVADCPAANTVPFVTPAPLNPVPATETVEIVKLAFPVFVSVKGCAMELSRYTLPKLSVVELGVSTPAGLLPLPPPDEPPEVLFGLPLTPQPAAATDAARTIGRKWIRNRALGFDIGDALSSAS